MKLAVKAVLAVMLFAVAAAGTRAQVVGQGGTCIYKAGWTCPVQLYDFDPFTGFHAIGGFNGTNVSLTYYYANGTYEYKTFTAENVSFPDAPAPSGTGPVNIGQVEVTFGGMTLTGTITARYIHGYKVTRPYWTYTLENVVVE